MTLILLLKILYYFYIIKVLDKKGKFELVNSILIDKYETPIHYRHNLIFYCLLTCLNI